WRRRGNIGAGEVGTHCALTRQPTLAGQAAQPRRVGDGFQPSGVQQQSRSNPRANRGSASGPQPNPCLHLTPGSVVLRLRTASVAPAQVKRSVRQHQRREKAASHDNRLESCVTRKGMAMIRLTYVLRRLPTLSRQEFQQYWRQTHGPLVAKHAQTLACRKYIQVHTL